MKTVVILLKDNLFDGMSGRSWIWEKERGGRWWRVKMSKIRERERLGSEEQSKDGNEEEEEFDEHTGEEDDQVNKDDNSGEESEDQEEFKRLEN